MRSITRRHMMLGALFGSGYIGLRSFLTGVPISVLRTGIIPSVHAAEKNATYSRQTLILNTHQHGDPFNANAPGCYGIEGVYNNPQVEGEMDMSPVPIQLGGQSYLAAKPWSMLSPEVLSRTTVIHHRTHENAHPRYARVMRLRGASRGSKGMGSDEFSALLSQENTMALNTVQPEQLSLGGGPISFNGRSLQSISPFILKELLSPLSGAKQQLQKTRDDTIKQLHRIVKDSGTQGQAEWLDRHVASIQQARNGFEPQILALLDNIQPLSPGASQEQRLLETSRAQLQAALVMAKLKVSPVITVYVSFGGDNHNDRELEREAQRTNNAFVLMSELFSMLEDEGLKDDVTVANLGVFGRTLKRKGSFNDDNGVPISSGRDHNLNHHVMMITGKAIRSSLIGGVQPMGNDFGAMKINPDTGQGIEVDPAQPGNHDTLSSAAKTLAVAIGIPLEKVEERINRGSVIKAALKPL